jgi:nucleoside-diphosphate-sugar epimerase
MPHHALVFGASGILGWAIVNEILNNYPNAGTYYKVTALTNRPLSRQDALWPESAPGMPELNIVSGIDLTKGTVEEVKKVMKERVPGIETVTHVFYFGKPLSVCLSSRSRISDTVTAYLFHPDFPSESEINLGMMQRGFGAVESMAPNLEYVIFPTGTKVRQLALWRRNG